MERSPSICSGDLGNWMRGDHVSEGRRNRRIFSPGWLGSLGREEKPKSPSSRPREERERERRERTPPCDGGNVGQQARPSDVDLSVVRNLGNLGQRARKNGPIYNEYIVNNMHTSCVPK